VNIGLQRQTIFLLIGACALVQPTCTETVVVEAQEVSDPSTTPILKLRLKKQEDEKKSVAWTTETVSADRFMLLDVLHKMLQRVFALVNNGH
jgi:hypothetical protein